jgi:hypothetical protein
MYNEAYLVSNPELGPGNIEVTKSILERLWGDGKIVKVSYNLRCALTEEHESQ